MMKKNTIFHLKTIGIMLIPFILIGFCIFLLWLFPVYIIVAALVILFLVAMYIAIYDGIKRDDFYLNKYKDLE